MKLDQNSDYAVAEVLAAYPKLRLFRVHGIRDGEVDMALYVDPDSGTVFQRTYENRVSIEHMQWIPGDINVSYMDELKRKMPFFVDVDEPASSAPVILRDPNSFARKKP